MDELAKRIAKRVTDAQAHLTMVRNADGFLSRPDTQEAVRRECGVLLLPIRSAIELRVRYELEDSTSEQKTCYLVDSEWELLPDMKPHIADKGSVSLADLMPAYDALEVKKASLSWNIASEMYRKKYTHDLSPSQTEGMVRSATNLYGDSVEAMTNDLLSIPLDWSKPQTIEALSKVLLRAIQKDRYEDLQPAIRQINNDFQQWLEDHYAMLPSSSYRESPKLVNRVLPHIASKHERQEKVTLIVIDGMAYWQYLVLGKRLEEKGLKPTNGMTMAWIPTITKLSRQAIFRGNTPSDSYQQNPVSEERLWKEFWTAPERRNKRMGEYELAYQHGSLSVGDASPMRLALVDVELDEKMHASSNNKDLCSLTENWAERAAGDILDILDKDYTLYLTTDHGNLLSHGWRGLSSQEKTFLYKDGSRGKRHLIYNKVAHRDDFVAANNDVAGYLLLGSNWLVWKNDRCFTSKDCITHGGSHFLEVVVPFVKIQK